MIKSGLMVGLGESKRELFSTMRDLFSAGVDILTIGQYLPPTLDHYPLKKMYSEEEFREMADYARSVGFRAVNCGTYVRSSYQAAELYQEAIKNLNNH